MKRLNLQTKEDIRKNIDRIIDSPDELYLKKILLQMWVIGLMENADTHEQVFFEARA